MITKLTPTTAIPTAVRGKIRAFIKGCPQWSAYCAAVGVDSRQAKNALLIRFALHYNYDVSVLAIINGVSANKMGHAILNPKPVAPVVIDVPEIITEAEMAQIEQQADMVTEAELIANSIEAQAYGGPGTFSSDAVLSNVEQFLSSFVRAELVKALEPVLQSANKPEVVKEIEKIVIRDALPVAPAGALAYAIKGNQVPIGKIFGFKGEHSHSPISLWEAHGAAPAIDPLWVVNPFDIRALGTAIERGTNVWLVGPGGSGKSTMPCQFAAYVGRPYVKISFTRNSHVDDMIGGTGVKQGDTQWDDGVLIQAMKRPGTIIHLDEISLAPAGVQGIFQGVADDARTYFLPTGEKVVAAAGVVFVVADNTNGQGDETGLYHGTNPCNAALVNRFKRMVKIDYISKELEAAALHNHTKAPPAACEHVADFMARARKMPQMENVVLSLRNMVGMVQGVMDGFSPKQSFEMSVLNALANTERAALETLFTLTWAAEFSALMAGSQIDVAHVAQTAQGSGAQTVFDDEVSAAIIR